MQSRQFLKLKRACALLTLISATTAASADANNYYFFAYHINGINTTLDEAKQNLNALFGAAKVKSNIIKWDVLYNATHGIASDLYDVMRQKKQEKKSLTLDSYVEDYMKAHDLHYQKGSQQYEALKVSLKNAYTKNLNYVGHNYEDLLNQYYDKTETSNSAHFASITEELKNKDTSKTFVLLLPHSQGNLYANSLADYLGKTGYKYIYNFGFATPADHTTRIGFNWPSEAPIYITANNDRVINSLRTVTKLLRQNQPLSANVTLAACKDRNRCHGLTEAYLIDEYVSRVTSYYTNFHISMMIAVLNKSLLASPEGKNSPQIFFRCNSYTNPSLDNHDDDLCGADMGINNELLCVDGQCDPRKFGYVRQTITSPMPLPYPADVSTQRITFNLPGALKPGRYWFASHLPKKDSYNYSFPPEHTLLHLYQINLSYDCYNPHAPAATCAVEKIEQPSSFGGHFNLYDHSLGKDDSLACKRLPALCPNGKLIFGEIELS